MRVCLEPGCPNLQPESRCEKHKPAHSTHTRTATQRGYGAAHRKLREQWRPKVEAGLVNCARCGKRIAPNAAWDLGHDDHDRTKYRGPEHANCNRSRRPARVVARH
jgi:hypothetical protein